MFYFTIVYKPIIYYYVYDLGSETNKNFRPQLASLLFTSKYPSVTEKLPMQMQGPRMLMNVNNLAHPKAGAHRGATGRFGIIWVQWLPPWPVLLLSLRRPAYGQGPSDLGSLPVLSVSAVLILAACMIKHHDGFLCHKNDHNFLLYIVGI